MASASWIESSIAVSTAGTTTSDQEAGPRGRQPRMRWASAIAVKLRRRPGTRFSDAAAAAPVRASGAGRASTTWCGSSSSDSGATARTAAATARPEASPKASASKVQGPPISTQPSDSTKSGSAPKWLKARLSITALTSRKIFRAR